MADAAKKLTPARLAEVAGEAIAAAIMRRYGGRRIPRLSALHVKRAQRNEAVRRYVDAHGYAAAAEHFAMSDRQVRRISNGY